MGECNGTVGLPIQMIRSFRSTVRTYCTSVFIRYLFFGFVLICYCVVSYLSCIAGCGVICCGVV